MSLRFEIIEDILTHPTITFTQNDAKITDIFGENVFTLTVARQFLNEDAFKSLSASIKSSKKIDRSVANQIANGLKAWAQTKGVSHFTHWFQPLTGATAEKHDSFFTLKSDGTAIEEFD